MNKSMRKSMPTFFCKSKKTDAKTDVHFDSFGIASHEKSKFSENVHVRESHDFPSRMRVVEGSPKKKESKKER